MEQSEVFKMITDAEMDAIVERALGIGRTMHDYAWYYLGDDNARVVIEGAIWKAAALVAGKLEQREG
jgi:hypothetical protein